MADDERVRVEIAFEGGTVLGLHVPPATAEDLDRALATNVEGGFSFEAEDGRYTLALRQIVYVKRFARESRVGFGAVAGG